MNFRYRWAQAGDVNAFFGLVLDNIAGLMLIVGILAGFGIPPRVFGYPSDPRHRLGCLLR